MASSALPTIFPAEMIGREYFGDGALRQLSPISAALHMGAERVVIIGVGGGRLEEEVGIVRNQDRGLVVPGSIECTPPARAFFGGRCGAVAPPDGSRGAQPTFVIEGVDVLVMQLLAA